jgi:Fic family protein
MKIPEKPPSVEKVFASTDMSKIDMNEYIETAKRFNSDYSHWNSVRYRTKEGLDPKVVWAIMKIMRESGYQPITISDLEVKYSMIEQFQKTIHDIDMQVPASILSGKGLSDKERKMYSVSSVMEESIASSQIEGAATTRQVAKKMLREGRHPRNRSEQMIINSYNAMRLIKNLKDKDLTHELILSVHQEITKNTLNDHEYEGRYRDTDDIVVSDAFTGKVFHKPIGSEKINVAMKGLCDYVNSETPFVHPLIKGIIIHYLIGYIHPFVDGNGRLARSLFYWYLLKKGYWIIEFLSLSRLIKEHRSKYDMSYLLSETDQGDTTYFIKFNLKMVEGALDDFIRYVEKERKEQHEFELKVSDNANLPMRQRMIVLDAMRSGEPFSIYEVQSKYQVTYQTARTDIMHLEEIGMVEKTGKISNQVLYSMKKNGKRADADREDKKSTMPPEKVRQLDNFTEEHH